MARRDLRQLGLADSIVRRRGKKSAWLERLDVVLRLASLGDDRSRHLRQPGRRAGLPAADLRQAPALLPAMVRPVGRRSGGGGRRPAVLPPFRRHPLARWGACPDHSSIWRFPRAAGAAWAWRKSCWPRSTVQLEHTWADPAPGHADRRHHHRSPAVRPPGGDAGEVARPAIRRPGGTKKNGQSRFGYKGACGGRREAAAWSVRR